VGVLNYYKKKGGDNHWTNLTAGLCSIDFIGEMMMTLRY
jgi:hypothetical protein